MKQLKFYWHIHHGVLLEPLTEPLKNRIEYIKNDKPKEEIELRLKLIKPVKGKLPKELIKKAQEWYKIQQKYNKVAQEYDKIKREYEIIVKGRYSCLEYGKIVKKYYEVVNKYRKIIAEYNKIGKENLKKVIGYENIIQKYLPQLKTLHKKECGCGYDFKRKTIFTKKNGFKK